MRNAQVIHTCAFFLRQEIYLPNNISQLSAKEKGARRARKEHYAHDVVLFVARSELPAPTVRFEVIK